MADLIVLAVVVAIVGGAGAYIYKAKKNGARCVGCSNAGNCGKAHSQCGCHSKEE